MGHLHENPQKAKPRLAGREGHRGGSSKPFVPQQAGGEGTHTQQKTLKSFLYVRGGDPTALSTTQGIPSPKSLHQIYPKSINSQIKPHQDLGNIWEAPTHNSGVYLGWDLTGHLVEAKFYLQFLKDSFQLSVPSLDSWRVSTLTPHTRGPFQYQRQEHEQAHTTFKLLL